jgi:hypothetical protein
VTTTEHGARVRGAAAEGEGVSIETAFAHLVGRQATQAEGERLHRLRSVLGLRDNDAFWSIVIALEHYDSFFRAYPAQLAEVTGRTIENVRAACASAAAHEIALVQHSLSEKVAETSVVLARKLADRPVGIHRVTLVLAAVVAFGALCVHAGYELAGRSKPFWIADGRSNLQGAQGLLAAILAVPAGWMIFALLVPSAAYGAKVGWALAYDAMGSSRDRAVGWCVMALCIVGFLACAALMVKLT